MASFMQVLRVAGVEIGDYAGCFVRVPTMKNGRCFPSSVFFASADMKEIQVQVQLQRNDIGCPVRSNGSIDKQRHDEEVQIAKEKASEIVRCFSAYSPQSADVIQRLKNGHVTEEDDIKVIAEACGMHIEIVLAKELHDPFMDFNPAGAKQVRLVLTTDAFATAGHFEALRVAPSRALMHVCIEACKVWCLVPPTTDRQVVLLTAEVAKFRGRTKRLHKKVNTLLKISSLLARRVRVLEGIGCQETPSIKRPPSAFALYCQDARRQGNLVGLNASEQARRGAEMWKELSDHEKEPYKRSAGEALQAYAEAKRSRVA